MSSNAWIAAKRRQMKASIPRGSGAGLEVGGGASPLARCIEELGYSSFGLDLDPSGGQRIVKGDAHSLPFVPNSFDVVVACDCLHHLQDPRQFIREAARVLAPGGSLVIWVPFLYPFHGNDLWRFTPPQLSFMFEDAGLETGPVITRLSLASLFALIVSEMLDRSGLSRFGEILMSQAVRWDERSTKRGKRGQAYAVACTAVARKQSL